MASDRVKESTEFEAIIRPHLDYVYGLAVRLCGSRAGAEDVVQDALLRAFRGLGKLRNRERPRLWLTRILTRAFYDRLRDTSASEAVSIDESFDLFDKIVEEDPFPYSDRVHLDFLEIFDDTKIIEVLQRLHPTHRVALILAYVYEYKTREIAAIMNKPLGTVLVWLHRARKQLEQELWEYADRNRLLTPQQEARV